jgi:hypothetical protein
MVYIYSTYCALWYRMIENDELKPFSGYHHSLTLRNAFCPLSVRLISPALKGDFNYTLLPVAVKENRQAL